MAEINIRIMQDDNGVPFYPATHIEAVNGLDEDELLTRVAQLEAEVALLKSQISSILASL